MRLVISLLGTEVLSVELSGPQEPSQPEPGEEARTNPRRSK